MPVPGIYAALTGMHAHRKILDTTAHNVANQITPGYRRQIVDLSPLGVGTSASVFAGQGSNVMGVSVEDTRRVMNEIDEHRARSAVAIAAEATEHYASMKRIEDIFAEPTERGLAAEIDAFWVSWSDLADRAADPVARSEVMNRATAVINRLSQASADLRTLEQDAVRRLETMAAEVNHLTAQIADLNASISASSNNANSLMDERDRLAGQLTTMVGGVMRTTERGQIAITVGGRLLVSNGSAYEVKDQVVGTPPDDHSTLVWDMDDTALQGGPSELSALNRLLSETIPDVREGLDGFVAEFVTEVNALHLTGYGIGADGQGFDLGATPPDNAPGNFFDPTGLTIDTLALDDYVATKPYNIAAGLRIETDPGPPAVYGPPGLHDGTLAQQIGDLAADGDSTTTYRTWVTQFGLSTGAAGRRAGTTQDIASRAVNDAESTSGVNLDEELTMMMAAQQGYEASARVLQAVDEMLDIVMRMV